MHLPCWTPRGIAAAALLLSAGLAVSARGGDPAWSEQAGLGFWSGSGQLPPPHLVIRAPTPPPPQAASRHGGFAPGLVPAASTSLPAPVDGGHVVASRGVSPEHEAHRRGHWWQKPAPATIPGAVVEPVWRTPYSYGYFGAGRNRHWQRHYGSRQSYTQWTLK